ncbi:MAG: sugar phosphate isomerase/epimerase family protein [Phycisphaerae bacterium]
MKPLRPGFIGIISDDAKHDFWSAMKRAADMGYRGVESLGAALTGDVQANARRLRELGLEPLTIGTLREGLREETDTLLRQAEAAGVRRVSCWWAPAESREQLLADAELYNSVGRRFAEAGIRLAYHHHDHELLECFDGVRALDLLAANTDPAHVGFVVDIAWAVVGREDPAALVRRLGRRVTSLHVKDVALADRGPDGNVAFTAVGTGVVPLAGAMAAAAEVGVEWAVVEQDKLRNLTAWDTLQVSLLNLVEMGLVEAN